MTIQTKGPVLVTIVGFSAIILVLLGLIVGWKWIAPATDAAEEERTTAAVTIQRDLIAELESFPGMEDWGIDYNGYDGSYDMSVDIGDETVYFNDRKSLSDFLGDLERLAAFQE